MIIHRNGSQVYLTPPNRWATRQELNRRKVPAANRPDESVFPARWDPIKGAVDIIVPTRARRVGLSPTEGGAK
jgi:hypothetical protein